MSHIVTIQVEYHDLPCMAQAVTAMGGTILGMGVHKLFAGQSVEGVGYTLPGWRYPIVLSHGKLSFDNYNGAWGNPADLGKLRQSYAREVAIKQAKRAGFRVIGQSVAKDGSIVLKMGRG